MDAFDKEFCLTWGVILAIFGMLFGGIAWSGYTKIDDIRQNAPQHLLQQNWRVVNYLGYSGTPFIGGEVCYNVAIADNSDKHLYTLCVHKWGKEYQITDLHCVNCGLSAQ